MAPVRTCVGCRRRAGQEELVRVAVAAPGRIELGRNVPGRGAWLCRGSSRCLEVALTRGALTRALRAPVGAAEAARLAEQFSCGRM